MKTRYIIFATCSLWFLSCKKSIQQEDFHQDKSKLIQNVQNVLQNNLVLDVNYENGEKDSGIDGLGYSEATAPDAASMIQPGATGDWGIAHKTIMGNPDYVSAGKCRSESDAMDIVPARNVPGNEFRYEFSVYLKDWQTWTSPTPAYGDIIFQNKPTSSGPNFHIATKRNAIIWRSGNSDQADLLTDYRPYINQWIDFRIEVLWANTTTGYFKIYVRLPGQSNYTLKKEYNNYKTYIGASNSFGYIKWGLYRPDEVNPDLPPHAERIVYHDDIRVYRLN